jgi:3-deoxy-alpha-D-manno-octulosonate 8-oxidase
LSYGLSFVLGTRHGVGNCIVFDQLQEYYPAEVAEFRRMVERHDIEIPRGLTQGLTADPVNEMVRVALSLTPLWENALGKDWQQKMTPEVAKGLLARM